MFFIAYFFIKDKCICLRASENCKSLIRISAILKYFCPLDTDTQNSSTVFHSLSNWVVKISIRERLVCMC